MRLTPIAPYDSQSITPRHTCVTAPSRIPAAHHIRLARPERPNQQAGVTIMKTIVSALIALSVLAGIAAPASALDAKKFWDEHPTSSER
jgi:hypothetical protein